jgi:hypothetical protein
VTKLLTPRIGQYYAVLTETHELSSAAAAFDQWYASDRRRDLYYIAVYSTHLDQKVRTHALPKFLKLSGDYLSEPCILPNG